MRGERSSSGYQVMLVGLLSLNFGILFFDRNALNFLMPFVQPDLGLSNTQVGLLSSALSFAWALSGYFVGRFSDRSGYRKPIIIAAGVLFSACSILSGFAHSFLMLFAARLLMGMAEGGVMPVSHALVVREVAPERRGVAMGVAQNLGSNVLGSSVAPLVLVPFALAFGWRDAFYLAAVPGLISAALIWLLVREPERESVEARGPRQSLTLAEAFAVPNIRLCAVISVLLVSYLVVCWAFMPLYLTQARGFSPDTMKWLMAVLGISAGVGSFIVPGLSDYMGRKPLMLLVPLVGVTLPLAAIYWSGPVVVIAAAFFLGWALNGLFPMFMATIPSETVGLRHAALATGIVMATGEVLGGVISPLAAGLAADRFGLEAPLWIMFGLCLCASVVAFGLKETAPRVLGFRTRPTPTVSPESSATRTG